jgi:L,D-transpeptidase catalytic domain
MRFIRIAIAVLLLPALMANKSAPVAVFKKNTVFAHTNIIAPVNEVSFYDSWNLSESGLSKKAFEYGLKGYTQLQQQSILTIVDYSLASTEKRLYVINMKEGKLLFCTLAAHGKNSGLLYANDFSNKPSSLKSSLGFFVTGNTYTGANGYSLKLNGCEKGINNNALQRAIVMHGADYVSDNFANENGYLGRSHGCPAVPQAISKKIIDCIKNGSCLFLYAPETNYISSSKILNNQN